MTTASSDSIKSRLISLPDDQSLLLADICEEFLRRRESGEDPAVDEYAARYPEMASVIQDVIPALDALGNTSAFGSATVPLPTEVARCRIVREIGRGAMGVVYEAIHPTVSRRLAIKVLHPSLSRPGRAQDRFLREAEAASRLCHPHIVPFVDFGSDEGNGGWLSMLYVDGCSLDRVVDRLISCPATSQQSPLNSDSECGPAAAALVSDFRQLAKTGADVASALSHAHSLRIVHRDIKPANLILDSNGRIWVTDFGLAKIHNDDDNLSRTGDLIGTPRYMAPEQIRGICSTHSDIYALGVTLYELAARQKAWETVPRNRLLSVRASMDLPDLSEVAPHVPAGLARVIMKACALRPEDRYETAAEMEFVLRRLADGHTEGDRRRRDRVEGQRFVRRRPVMIGLASVLLATALACGLSALTRPDLPETPAELLQALQQDDIVEQVVDALPDESGGDSHRKQQTRAEVADRAYQAVGRTVDSLVDDDGDRGFLKEQVREVTDAYRNGEVTRAQTQEAVDYIRTSNVIAIMRVAFAQQQLMNSRLRETEKRVGLNVLRELTAALQSGRLSQTAVAAIKQSLPSRSRELSVGLLEQQLRSFLNTAMAAVNGIADIPAGQPGTAARLEFLSPEPKSVGSLQD